MDEILQELCPITKVTSCEIYTFEWKHIQKTKSSYITNFIYKCKIRATYKKICVKIIVKVTKGLIRWMNRHDNVKVLMKNPTTLLSDWLGATSCLPVTEK